MWTPTSLTVVAVAACFCSVGYGLPMAASPVDRHATARTSHLLNFLHTLSRDPHKFLFGQQAPTLWGIYGGHAPYELHQHDGNMSSWKFTQAMAASAHSDELCDVCALVNDFPAVVGFDLNTIERNMTDILTHLVKQASRREAVLTVSWHHRNPVTGGPFYIKHDDGDVLHTVKRLLPGGDHHSHFLSDLDAIAVWAKGLTDSQGRAIPVIFRPFHEASLNSFWGGLHNNAQNTAADVVRLYQTVVRYLRDTKGVHNFLYAFSPACNYDWDSNPLYPGNSYVDIIGVDCYESRAYDAVAMTTAVEGAVTHAQRAGKVAAWTEFGLASGSNWEAHTSFFTHILRTMRNSSIMTNVAYMLTWHNNCSVLGTCIAFAPYPGHPVARDFTLFHNDSHVMFASDLKNYAPWFSNK